MKSIHKVVALLLAFSPAVALAGECPAGKEGPNPLETVTKSSGMLQVVNNGEIQLGEEAVKADGWRLRSRTIYFGKDAVAQVHSHDKRPEIATMLSGEVTIYATNCTVGVVMKPGDVYKSEHGDEHWAVNESGAPAVMYATDVVSVDTFPVSGGM